MKIVGLIGGMSWESTLDYYRILNETVKNSLGKLHSCKCLMYSVDFEEIAELQNEQNWDALSRKMVEAAMRVKGGGADFILICTNTMHKVADDVERESGLKVLHIADAAGEKILELGMKKVGLLGTKFTMEEDFYKNRLFEKYGINVIIPEEEDRNFIHNVIFKELCLGKILPESKEKFAEIIGDLEAKGAEGIVLGCTEIPLMIKQEDFDIPIFNTSELHAKAAVKLSLDL